MDDDVRPRVGSLTRLCGWEQPVRFVPTDDPLVFLAVSVDGEPLDVQPGESLRVDVIGPGQAVRVGVER